MPYDSDSKWRSPDADRQIKRRNGAAERASVQRHTADVRSVDFLFGPYL